MDFTSHQGYCSMSHLEGLPDQRQARSPIPGSAGKPSKRFVLQKLDIVHESLKTAMPMNHDDPARWHREEPVLSNFLLQFVLRLFYMRSRTQVSLHRRSSCVRPPCSAMTCCPLDVCTTAMPCPDLPLGLSTPCKPYICEAPSRFALRDRDSQSDP